MNLDKTTKKLYSSYKNYNEKTVNKKFIFVYKKNRFTWNTNYNCLTENPIDVILSLCNVFLKTSIQFFYEIQKKM